MRGKTLLSQKKSGVAVLDNLQDICVSGITPFTTIDFPGRLAGVFYLQGCPWRCRYCYNAEFWSLPPAGSPIPFSKIFDFLNSRKGHLDGIVFSGGEPTIHERLPVWMKEVKSMGYQIGLHTGGMYPERLVEVLPLCDWVGLDIKAPFNLYDKVTGIMGSGEKSREGARKVLASGVSYEFRTTFHSGLLSEIDLKNLAGELVSMGCRYYTLQMFRGEHCPDKELRADPFSKRGISAGLRQELKELFVDFKIREA